MAYVIAYDIGTTGVKTCIFSLEDKITLIADANEGYGLYIGENGEAEQDCDEWWQAMCSTTRKALKKAELDGSAIEGVSFCSQMQGIVLVDENGSALRRPMSYMDQRAKQEVKDGITGGIEVAGGNVFKVLNSLRINKAVATSVKDPVWKYKWVQNHEPEVFKKLKYWLDVKDYLVGRCTGTLAMTEDSAFATLLYDTRRGHEGWSDALCKMYKVDKIGFEKPSAGIMRARPVKKESNLFGLSDGLLIAFEGLMIGALSLAAYFIGDRIAGAAAADTMCFCVLSLSQLFHAYCMRSETPLFRVGFFGNPMLIAALAVSTAVQLAVMLIPSLAAVFDVVPLSGELWTITVLLASVPLILGELRKIIFRR